MKLTPAQRRQIEAKFRQLAVLFEKASKLATEVAAIIRDDSPAPAVAIPAKRQR